MFARRCHGQRRSKRNRLVIRRRPLRGGGESAWRPRIAVDSPLYRVGADLEPNGVGMSVSYDGAFGETVEQSAISASLKVSF
ncbi:hypothetical protein ASD12_15185 [Mesorhizobium sp. Root102]|nr:hypothetical protein ASD12_15185 [Mesorhizobium sp. Root102]